MVWTVEIYILKNNRDLCHQIIQMPKKIFLTQASIDFEQQ